MKFVFGQRVKIIGGFYDGSIGMVANGYPNDLGEVDKYSVLIIPPDWVAPSLYMHGVGIMRTDVKESSLEGVSP